MSCASTRTTGKGIRGARRPDRATGDVAVFTDCDLAYPLANIDGILGRIADGADAAIACRVSRRAPI